MDDNRQSLTESIRSQFANARRLQDRLESLLDPLQRVIERSLAAYRTGGKLILFGNGGSAADAQHIVAEMLGHFRHDRPALAALALTTNTSVLTAIGNDYSFESIFSRQVETMAQPKDIVIGITTSGRSANVLEGLKAAHDRGVTTVGLCGAVTEALAPFCDEILSVPSADTPRIQEVHILVGHILCQEVERVLMTEASDA